MSNQPTKKFDRSELTPGCVLDGHRGWRITADLVVDVAHPRGFVIEPEEFVIINAFYDSESIVVIDGEAVDTQDAIIEMAGCAEAWLNERTPEGLAWYWHDGEFFLSLVCIHCGEPVTDDGTLLVDDTGGDVCGVNGTIEDSQNHLHCTGFVVDETVEFCAACFLAREDHGTWDDALTDVSGGEG